MIALLLSTLLGFFIIETNVKHPSRYHPLLTFFLAPGLGLGCSGVLVFLSLIMFGQYSFFLVVGLHGLALFLLLIISARERRIKNSPFLRNLWPHEKLQYGDGLFAVLFLLLMLIIKANAETHPYGEWEAWAIWNMKAKFLLEGGAHWQTLLTLDASTHPNAPLLLPSMVTWLHSENVNYAPTSPFVLGIIFTALASGLVYASIRQLTSTWLPAIMGWLSLSTLPFFLQLGTAQYTDIGLAYFLLMTLTTLFIAIKDQHTGMALISGCSCGLLSFINEHGTVLSGLIIVCTTGYFIVRRQAQQRSLAVLTALGLGTFLTGLSTLTFKMFFAANGHHFPMLNVPLSALNWSGLQHLLRDSVTLLLQPQLHGMWIIMLVLMLINCQKWQTDEKFIGFLVLIGFGLIVSGNYLLVSGEDIHWQLYKSLGRAATILLPSVLVFNFYCLWDSK